MKYCVRMYIRFIEGSCYTIFHKRVEVKVALAYFSALTIFLLSSSMLPRLSYFFAVCGNVFFSQFRWRMYIEVKRC